MGGPGDGGKSWIYQTAGELWGSLDPYPISGRTGWRPETAVFNIK